MRIEVATDRGATSKEKGDLFESLIGRFLVTRGYGIERQVRITGTELDLLCKDAVNGDTIYVECKAERDPLSAVHLRSILGTIELHGYTAGWLVSAGPLGKDAKGVKEQWEAKPQDTRRRLSIYDPARVIEALVAGNIVVSPTSLSIAVECDSQRSLGEWLLVVTKAGLFWIAPILNAGVPRSLCAFDATSGSLVEDSSIQTALSATDFSLHEYPIESPSRTRVVASLSSQEPLLSRVVEVAQAENWSDYRPARPCDFVGRDEIQNQLIDFLNGVRTDATRTRVFALTGDTGIGKSSLLTKMRDRLNNSRNRKHYCISVVDMRAARGPGYVGAACLHCLRQAAKAGYGKMPKVPLELTDGSDPLASSSIDEYLRSVAERKQTICLVLDQFEELYSKPDLLSVFDEARLLLISTVAAGAAFCMGVSFRSDAMVQQDHPAYYIWNRLHDLRYELKLRPFTAGEASGVLTGFEKELGTRLRPDIRRKLAENCGGLPWLLKKLCIHVLEQVRDGRTQDDLDGTMDVAALFANDLASCTPTETNCVKTVARMSPADWSEVVEVFGVDVVRGLQDRRLIIRNGDRLNLYWDVFREFVLTGSAPPVPLAYLWSSPSIGAFLTVASRLSRNAATNAARLSEQTGLSIKTVGNVIHDLTMFGVARGTPGEVHLADRLGSSDEITVLERLRVVLKQHALGRWLARWPENTVLDQKHLIQGLREIYPSATHSSETWKIYAERLGPWLVAAGLVDVQADGLLVRDSGQVHVPSRRGSRFRLGSFRADAPPARVAEALVWLSHNGPCTRSQIQTRRFRNAIRVLDHFELTSHDVGGIEAVVDVDQIDMAEGMIRDAARSDDTLIAVSDWLRGHPNASGVQLGSYMSEREGQMWTTASRIRIGNAIRMWASWIAAPTSRAFAPGPRVRKQRVEAIEKQLFNDVPSGG